MKKLFIIFIIFISAFVFGQDIEYNRTVDRCLKYYQSSIIEHNNRIFLFSQNSIELFNINTNGEINFINSYYHSYSTSLLNNYNDTLIVITKHSYEETDKLELYDISNNNFEKIREIDLNTSYFITKFYKNDRYLFYYIQGEHITKVRRRNDFSLVAQLNTTLNFGLIGNNYLFSKINNNGNYSIIFTDITNINNPIEISSLPVNNNQDIINYKIENNYLYIVTKFGGYIIIDISDIFEPELVYETNHVNNYNNEVLSNIFIRNNILILSDIFSKFWLYDISNIENPVFLTLNSDYQAFPQNPHIYIIESSPKSLLF